MNRVERVAIFLTVVAASVATIVLLALAGPRSEGPLARLLGAVGSVVSRTESRTVAHYRGSEREDALAWFAPYRRDPARLRAPAGLLLGAYDGAIPRTLDGVLGLEQALGTTFPLVQVYTAWGDAPEEQFPRRFVQAVWELGSVPVVTWEPWLSSFESPLHPELPLRKNRDRGGLAAVAGGSYDAYIDRWAEDAAAWGHPLFVRFAHEMNDPYRYPWGPQNNTADDYVAAWRHVVERFRRAGATNVLWVWSPHMAHAGIEAYYPGDDVVDWIGAGALNYGAVAYWSKWWSFKEIFGDHYEDLARFEKPIMIAEFGTLAVGGERRRWYDDALANLRRAYPRVHALLFFNTAADRTVTQQTLDWTFTADSVVLATVRARVARLGP